MKKSFFFAALVAIMCAFSSCVKEPTIIGKWQLKTMKMQLIINGQVAQTVEEAVLSEEPAYWQFVDENTLKIIEYYDGHVLTEELTYTLNGNTLTITPVTSPEYSITCQVVNLTETELSLTRAIIEDESGTHIFEPHKHYLLSELKEMKNIEMGIVHTSFLTNKQIEQVVLAYITYFDNSDENQFYKTLNDAHRSYFNFRKL